MEYSAMETMEYSAVLENVEVWNIQNFTSGHFSGFATGFLTFFLFWDRILKILFYILSQKHKTVSTLSLTSFSIFSVTCLETDMETQCFF